MVQEAVLLIIRRSWVQVPPAPPSLNCKNVRNLAAGMHWPGDRLEQTWDSHPPPVHDPAVPTRPAPGRRSAATSRRPPVRRVRRPSWPSSPTCVTGASSRPRVRPGEARLWSEHFSRHRAAQRGDRDGHLIVLVDDPPVKRPWLLLTYAAIDGFAQEVGVTRMAGRFLDEMQQNPAQREAPPAAKRLH